MSSNVLASRSIYPISTISIATDESCDIDNTAQVTFFVLYSSTQVSKEEFFDLMILNE